MNRCGSMVREFRKRAAALMPAMLAFGIGLAFGPAPAKALDYYSGIENEGGSSISMWAVSSLDYDNDCEFYRLCSAYAEAQEYVDGSNSPLNWSSDEDDTYAEADLVDGNVFAGSTYTVVGYHYYWNDPDGDLGDGSWVYYGWDDAWVTVPFPPPPPPPTPPAPQITGISPGSGVTNQPGYIAIYGYNLSGDGSAYDVSVTMDNANLSVVYISDQQVNVYYSSLTAGNHSITLWTSGGGSNSATFTGYDQDPTPVISSVSPGTWSYTQSNSITITGMGFGTSPSVYASYPDGAQEALNVTNAADTEIFATANHLSTAAGWVELTVQSNGYWNQGFVGNLPDSSTDSNGAYVPVPDPTPTITSISPGAWQAGNVYGVTIYGSGFGEAPTVTINFPDGTTQTFSRVSASDNHVSATASLTVSVPSGEPDGDATVTVTSNGYLGNGFQAGGGGGGASATSSANVVALPPVLSVKAGNTAVSAGSTVFLTADPAFPTVTAQMFTAAGAPVPGNVLWRADIVLDTLGSYVWSCFNPSAPPSYVALAGNAAWHPFDFFGSNLCGGRVTITYVHGTWTGALTFYLRGQNPAATTVKTRLGTSPWFLQQLVNSENGYLQFDNTGMPSFGPPNGFGIMQLDPPDDPSQIWTWTNNVDAGKGRLNGFGTSASTYWAGQLNSQTNYNNAHPGNQATPPPDTTEGPCVFSYSPAGSKHPYVDGVWIKMYNSGPNTNRQYISFDSSSGTWKVDSLNNLNFDYVLRVCSATP